MEAIEERWLRLFSKLVLYNNREFSAITAIQAQAVYERPDSNEQRY